MSTISQVLCALLLSFAIGYAVYGIVSKIVKCKKEKEFEEWMKERESRGDYDDDDDYYYD